MRKEESFWIHKLFCHEEKKKQSSKLCTSFRINAVAVTRYTNQTGRKKMVDSKILLKEMRWISWDWDELKMRWITMIHEIIISRVYDFEIWWCRFVFHPSLLKPVLFWFFFSLVFYWEQTVRGEGNRIFFLRNLGENLITAKRTSAHFLHDLTLVCGDFF